MTPHDAWALEQFQNFLRWSVHPATGLAYRPIRPIPPAVFAYIFGLTEHCPPPGVM
jgi:hypothetical protein